jgi:hypothetical protein
MRENQTRTINPGEMRGTGSRSRVDVAGFQSNASSCAWGDNSSRLPGPESCPRQPRLRYHNPCEGDSVRWVTRGQRCGRTTGLCEVEIIFPWCCSLSTVNRSAGAMTFRFKAHTRACQAHYSSTPNLPAWTTMRQRHRLLLYTCSSA